MQFIKFEYGPFLWNCWSWCLCNNKRIHNHKLSLRYFSSRYVLFFFHKEIAAAIRVTNNATLSISNSIINGKLFLVPSCSEHYYEGNGNLGSSGEGGAFTVLAYANVFATNVQINNNRADKASVFVALAHATFNNCSFTNNHAGIGGGIRVESSGDITVNGCYFR